MISMKSYAYVDVRFHLVSATYACTCAWLLACVPSGNRVKGFKHLL